MRRIAAFLFFCSFCQVTFAAAPVQIWSYAFVTTKGQEPISGAGSAIFSPTSSGLEGPMWSQKKIGYHLEFGISGGSAEATLTVEKGAAAPVKLRGLVTETPEPDGVGCSVQASLGNGPHFVLLQRFAPCNGT